MTAYELADQLDNVKYQNGSKPFEMYANMLRQQADRIAELEKALEHEGISVGRDLLNGGVALSKKLPQTKPLSDEEIEAVLTPFVTAQFELNKTPPKFDYLGFVRAIEERHGIK